MGTLTRAQLMAQAGLAAGNDQAVSFVRVWLDAWLQRTAKSWAWPCLKNSATVPVDAGSLGVVVERGDVGDRYIHKLLNGVVFYRPQSGYTPNGRAFIRPLAETDPNLYEALTDGNPSISPGLPQTVKVRVGVEDGSDLGSMLLIFDKPTDRALYISFDAILIPDNLGTSEGNDTIKPWYPNDRTLIQACKVAILELDAAGERSDHYDGENLKLGAMVADDRDFDGEQAGDNQIMTLDPSVFR